MTIMINRRHLLKSAAKLGGLGSLAPYLGLGSVASVAKADDIYAPFILTVYCSGGWDPTMVFDPKLGTANFSQETGASLAAGAANIPFVDHGNRPSVKAFFNTYGTNACIVNGIYNSSIVRTAATIRTLGIVPPRQTRPVDWSTHYASILNPGLPIPHAVLGDMPYLPGESSRVAIKLSRRHLSHIEAELPPATPANDLGTESEEALATFRSKSFERFSKRSPLKSLDGEKITALTNAYSQQGTIDETASDVLTKLGAQGADSDFIRDGKIALELFANNYTQCASIQFGAEGAWNTESDHYARQAVLFEELFSGLNTLLSTATSRSLASRLIVMVVSERGRTATLNSEDGKGSWPYTSAMLWGTTFASGKVLGQTDAVFRGVKINPLYGEVSTSGNTLIEMGHIMSAIYLVTGVRTTSIIPNYLPLAGILQS